MLYRLNMTLATPGGGYRYAGSIVDLEAEGCGLHKIKEWEEAGHITKTEEAPSPDVPVPAPTPPRPEPSGAAPIWNLDPEALQGMSLAALNVMIAERNPEIGPFETDEEAIAQLTLQTVKNEVENS